MVCNTLDDSKGSDLLEIDSNNFTQKNVWLKKNESHQSYTTKNSHREFRVAFQKGDFWSWVCASPNSSLEMLPLPSLSKSLNASSTALGTAAIYSPSTRGTLARCAAHKCYMRGFLVSLWAKNLTAFCGFLFTSLRIITNPLIDKKCQNIQQNDVKMMSNCVNSFSKLLDKLTIAQGES